MSAKPVAKVFVTLAATSGLALSTAGASQATSSAATPSARTGATAVPATPAPAASSAGLTATPAPSRVLPTPRSSSTYRWGSRGGSTRSIQRIVGAYPDGIFGPKTHSRVKRWQSRNGLVADGIVGPKTSRAMGLSSSSRGSSSASRSTSRSSSSVVTNAKRYLGVRYVWAGSSPSSGFDCSGYVNYVFKKSGVNLPRTAASIQRATTRTSNPRPGDLVFHGYPATHVGIYAGNGKFYDSGRSTRGTTLRTIFPGSVSYGRVN
ncbi:MAG: NlpC/P60 family protein [Ornithinimicrobium sp.]